MLICWEMRLSKTSSIDYFIAKSFINISINSLCSLYGHFIFRDDLWGAINTLHEKLSTVDQTKLIAGDIVLKITMHFEKIREAKVLV